MSRAYVLITAMPPTKGHLHLIQFAAQVGSTAEVVVATQPGEPFEYERVSALQAAMQRAVNARPERLIVVQDTDLFSTVGYWRIHPELGEVPQGLIDDAVALASDLYVVAPSNIPFEADPLRYGGDVREGSDKYWTDLLAEFNLPHIILTETSRTERASEANWYITEYFDARSNLHYDRITAESLRGAE